MNESLVKLSRVIVQGAKPDIAFLIEEDRVREGASHKHPLSYVEFSFVNQERSFYVFLTNILGVSGNYMIKNLD